MEAVATAARESHVSGIAGALSPAWLQYFRILGKPVPDSSELCEMLFAGQRGDGFVPDRPDSERTALPLQGVVLGKLLQVNRKNAGFLAPALRQAFERAMAQHRYLYAHRDIAEEGLLAIRFPEEDGFGNAAGYEFPASARPCIQDPFFNTCLSWSNESLIAVGHFLGEDVLEAMQWHELTIHAMNEKLWDDETGQYYAFDLNRGCPIPLHSLAAVLPLSAEIPTQEQAEKMLRILKNGIWTLPGDDFLLYPSCRPGAAVTDFRTGWRGPVWQALNWMLYEGLLRYDFKETAQALRKSTLNAISEYGFYDSYDPRLDNPGNPGIGSSASPAAAALALHWLLK